MTRVVTVVPHTHWDREWYAPFQTFRIRLVELMDGVLPLLESGALPHFLLDGQLAMIDDYVAIRPEAEERLRRLNATGRVAIGPWYVLMDEFLVSGETIIRDLQRGLARAAEFGEVMEIGYLPDMFGHIGQMPQLLRQFGFEHAVVWRGVPAAVNRDGFWWSSPDGSTIRAQYLWPEGYGNGAELAEDGADLIARVDGHLALMGDHCTGAVLWLYGTDHQVPSPDITRVVDEANAIGTDLCFRIGTLADHLAAAPTEGLPHITGELRSGARANLLMGVGSNRVDVKQAAARAERALERRAEPLAALVLPPDQWPGTLLDTAWLEVIRNAAHDSICACSHDDVCRAVLHRYAEATAIADGIAQLALDEIAARVPKGTVAVVNPSARTRHGLIRIPLPGVGDVEGAQVLSVREPVIVDATVLGRDLAAAAPWRSQEISPGTYLRSVTVDGTDVTFEADTRLWTNLLLDEVRATLTEAGAAHPDTPFRVRVVQPPVTEVLTRVEAPGFGWTTWEPRPLDVAPVTVTGRTLTNGIVTVEIAYDGTFALDGLAGFDRLVDDGDHGDTYNYSPPDHDVVVDTPSSVDVDVLESGPLRARVRIRRAYTWPSHVDDAARARVGDVAVEVTTTIDLHAGERLVRITTELDNRCEDHRLRTWFPLPELAATSRAECAFTVVERGRTAEGGPTELPLPTFPSRRFVQAGGLTVVHEGLLEYELVDDRHLALTLLRATGMLSRVELTNRPLPAGPPDPLPGAQVPGRHVLRYGVAVGDVDPYALVDDAFLPLEVVRGEGAVAAGTDARLLEITGAEVSALRRVDDALELRVFNPKGSPTTVHLPGRSGTLVDLRGRLQGTFTASFPLAPHAIATARLD